MKKRIIVFIFLVLSCFTLKGENELLIQNIYPKDEGFIWYYEGPMDFELISIISKIKNDNGEKTLVLKNIEDDMTGELNLKERIYIKNIVINTGSICIDKMIVLKSPLKIGNTWITNFSFPEKNMVYKAKVEICEIKEKTIKTKTTVIRETNQIYEEINVFEINKGHISKWYNVSDNKDFYRGYELKKFLKKPLNIEKWYLPY